jgi:hypothetical protein
MNPSRAQQTAAARIAALTLVNAMVFQEVLSAQDTRVSPLRRSLRAKDITSELASHWQFILDDIDYVPIFKVARELLESLPGNADLDDSIRFLSQKALEIVARRAALRHDLMGRVYHRLLVEAKFLGTYYTSVPAATLLLKVALSPTKWDVDWSNLEALSSLRVGDLACGTGTLLMAVAEAFVDNHVQACAAAGSPPHLNDVHRLLIERILHGYDVLPSALHLTASTLAMRATDVGFELTNLFNLPLGGTHHRLGSIEFLRGRDIAITQDLFGASVAPGQVTATQAFEMRGASLPDLDLCVMNPPFTRSVGGNLLFGSVPEAQRRQMQADLASLIRNQNLLANSTAGLGSVFVTIGDRYLKEGGRIALVLPKALLSGVAWGRTRELIQRRFQLEFVIVSHDPAKWNFSDNTELSEALIIARKHEAVTDRQSDVICVNLWKNPNTAFEALNIAQILIDGQPTEIEAGQGAYEVKIGEQKAGEVLSVPYAFIARTSWMYPCAFAQSELVRTAYHLKNGNLQLPGGDQRSRIQTIRLDSLGVLGPDRRDIWDGFSNSNRRTAYAAYWGHDAGTCLSLHQSPNRYLSPLSTARRGRPLRRVNDLWPKAGRLMLAERLWLKTQRLAAFRLDENAVSNVWWPLRLNVEDDRAEKALVLWQNSTLGLIGLLANREETRGAWIDFKKPVLEGLDVLDVSLLDDEQLSQLASAFDEISEETLKPFPHMAQDSLRAFIDSAFSLALGLPDLSILRSLLSQEPVVCLEPMT